MDNIRFRTRRGTRLESGSEFESADEVGRFPGSHAGDGLAIEPHRDEAAALEAAENPFQQHEAVDESTRPKVIATMKSLSMNAVGESGGLPVDKGSLDVASCANQTLPRERGTVSQPECGSGRPHRSLSERAAVNRDMFALD